jgi:hypothetical protein
VWPPVRRTTTPGATSYSASNGRSLAAVQVDEPLFSRLKHVREPAKSVARKIGRRPELGLGGRQVDRHVWTQPAPKPVGEEPADVVHVQVGEHHVGHGCGIDAGGVQSRGQPPDLREVRKLRPHPRVDEHGPAAAAHHDHVQRPLVHIRRLESVLQPSRQVGRVGVGGQGRGLQRKYAIADHQHVNLADPQRVARRNRLVDRRPTGVWGNG